MTYRQQHQPKGLNLFSRSSSSQAKSLQDDQQFSRETDKKNPSLGRKDLIIRMLAEVFKIDQGESFFNQTARWEQVSSSLVPISLYSRTTNKWVNYLLQASKAAASQSNQGLANEGTNSAMSPDSRDFLILLQQFHQRQQHQQQQPIDQYHQFIDGSIVFQVVAHDFLDGQCKKVLNLKLAQPGTRLGQASRYFIYWKQDSQAYSNTCCQQERVPLESSQRIWGLNFASTNDAKLFYDICSLNLVDLDFDSDYLKLLALNHGNDLTRGDQNLSNLSYHTRIKLNDTRGMNNSSSKTHHQISSTRKNQDQQQFARRNQMENHCSDINCLLCRTVARQQQLDRNRDIVDHSAYQDQCPIHSANVDMQSRHKTRSIRSRSRSTTRKVCNTDESSTRNRSISMPASPEHQKCPIHDQNDAETISAQIGCDSRDKHHPRCLSFMKKQKELIKPSTERPAKPVRGVIRDLTDEQKRKLHIHMQSNEDPENQIDTNLSEKKFLHDEQVSSSGHNQKLNIVNDSPREDSAVLSDQAEEKFLCRNFNMSRSAQRRSTGVDHLNINQFDSYHSAKLARAQYANSKKIKEFLSLDAGGLQSAPLNSEKFNQKTISTVRDIRESTGSTKLDQRSQVEQIPCNNRLIIDRERKFQSMGDRELRRGNSSFAVQNASTTTDDLPLDPSTKKLMFKLTSENLISEQNDRECSNDHQLQGSKSKRYDSRHNRAVSLGPEVNDGLRSRDARSDIGRRRSLERSMHVDLDSTLNNYSSSRMHNFTSQQYSNLNDTVNIQSSKMGEVFKEQTCQPQRNSMTKARGYLSDVPFEIATSLGKEDSNTHNTVGLNSFHEYSVKIGGSSTNFKSVPDICQMYTNSRINRENLNSKTIAESSKQIPTHREADCDHQQQLKLLPSYEESPSIVRDNVKKFNSNINPYAIPLCNDSVDSRKTYSRLCHSCPNSLRRIGKTSHERLISPRLRHLHHHAWQHPDCDKTEHVYGFCREAHKNGGYDRKDIPRPSSACQSENVFGRCKQHICECSICLGYISNNESIQRGKQNDDFTESCLFCRSKIEQMYNYQEFDKRAERMVSNAFDHESDCFMDHGKSYPHHMVSGQNSRIASHFGLYESDEDVDQSMLPHDIGDVVSRQNICESHRLNHEVFKRSASSYLNNTRTKPVHGYDKTMSRSSLKSRQRAKSQPPKNNITDSEFYLTKSVENVQKLIKEVQRELSIINDRHLACRLEEMKASRFWTEFDHDTLIGNSANQIDTKENQPNIDDAAANEDDRSQNGNLNRISLTSATRRASSLKCVGAIRKAGFLSVKKWILKRRQSIELARKQGWKKYWVCLRGSALLFHSLFEKSDTQTVKGRQIIDLPTWIQVNCSNQHTKQQGDDRDFVSQYFIEKEPRYLIIIEGGIAQPIPEHPKRDNIFCLSTTFGDAYLFQASCQLESDNWISAIHNACAASIARDLTREEAVKLFETKIRHLEVEAEKKLFLRQRLDSRLTSMSSMGHYNIPSIYELDQTSKFNEAEKQNTIQSLLHRLNHQLIALDIYIEQLHCEIYQLKCYLSSCGAQKIFYQSMQSMMTDTGATSMRTSIDLPHPRSLMMHVSKATKLHLIKLGVFTVSSFHAYVHARQGSADTILRRLQHQATSNSPTAYNRSATLDLYVKSHSISEALITKNIDLEEDVEKLMTMSDLKEILIKVERSLFNKIRETNGNFDHIQPSDSSDDHYSFRSDGEHVDVKLRLNSNSNCLAIIKYLLKIIRKSNNLTCKPISFLEYYLKFKLESTNERDNLCKSSLQYVAKRSDTIKDWRNIEYLELLEKIVFKIKLNRRRTDEESAPFGITIGAQLFLNKYDNLLNIYCNYIEWGSVADKAGLKDDDELLNINGIPVYDLDMMFIECIIQEESKLELIVRSSSQECPPNASLVDLKTWRPSGPSGEDSDNYDDRRIRDNDLLKLATSGLQVISDEYISSLVCPPPPSESDAFLRNNILSMRQKSDMTNEVGARKNVIASKTEPLMDDGNNTKSESSKSLPLNKTKSKSQQILIGVDLMSDGLIEGCDSGIQFNTNELTSAQAEIVGETQQQNRAENDELIQLSVGNSSIDQNTSSSAIANVETNQIPNNLERLKKSVIELLETEYAYLKHLEIINEHYMTPLADTGYLEMDDLKQMSEIIAKLINFQKGFYRHLINDIETDCLKQNKMEKSITGDESDEIDWIVRTIESLASIPTLKAIINSVARTFSQEAESFKLYSVYCAKYSRLQKILHPKRNLGSSKNSNLIASIPNTLDTFQTSSSLAVIGSGTQNHRDFLKPLGSFIAIGSGGNSASELESQLKHLNEFLSNLDSSSSSVSSSLPKYSGATGTRQTSDLSLKNATSLLSSSTSSKVSLLEQTMLQKPTSSAHLQNFESYLIKPIQRIVKYPMLLNSIIQSVQVFQVENECCSSEIQGSMKQMESVASYVNDTQKIYEEYGSIFKNIERQFLNHQLVELSRSSVPSIIVGPHQPGISLNVEELLYFGPVNWHNVHEFSPKLKKDISLRQILFVFNSCVVFICIEQIKATKKKSALNNSAQNLTTFTGNSNLKTYCQTEVNEIIRYQSLIPVSEVQVGSVSSNNCESFDGTTHSGDFRWELFRCSPVNSNSNLLAKKSKRKQGPGRFYLLGSETNELRNTFLRKIRSIIRESVKNMSLPSHN